MSAGKLKHISTNLGKLAGTTKELCLTETHIKDNEQRLEIYSSLFEQRGFILKLFD